MSEAGGQMAGNGAIEEAEAILACEAYWRLSPAQRTFVDHLLADPQMNQTNAYQKAYPKATRETARRSASRLMANDDIRQAIRELQDLRNRRLWLDQDKVLAELMNIAFADMGLFVSLEKGKLSIKDFKNLPPGATRAISEISKKKGELKLKLYDKRAALELLGKHLDMFRDKLELVDDRNLEERLAAAEKRLNERRAGK